MRIPYEFILQKQQGEEHPAEELASFIQGATHGDIMEAQLSAWMMAVWFKGMTTQETANLTDAMINTGKRIHFPNLGMPIGDKHSTGGVGDKITLMLAPLLAAAGMAVPTVTGRGLGFTGGTLDKLESIPGFRTDLGIEELIDLVRQYGLAFGAQTDDLVPADRKMYALRGVTGTIRSLPLITSSILSKKIAEGIEAIVFDVKCGHGAFMATEDEARELSKWLVKTANTFGLNAAALITDMNAPIGYTVGNGLEAAESIAYLKNEKLSDDLHDLTMALGGTLMQLTGLSPDINSGINKLETVLANGEGLKKFKEVAFAQGADPDAFERIPAPHPDAQSVVIAADMDGYISGIHAREVGYCGVELGAGRQKTGDDIDPAAGILFYAKPGDKVEKGQPVASLFAAEKQRCEATLPRLKNTIQYSEEPPAFSPLIKAITTKDGIRNWE